MTATHSLPRSSWSSAGAFILVATGATFGLSDIWRFPVLVAENGGGAFILLYLACALVLGFPLITAALLIGRCGERSPVGSVARLAREHGRSTAWRTFAGLGVLGGCVVLSYLSVFAGWSLGFMARSGGGTFEKVTAEGAASIFADLVSDPEAVVAWHTVFMVATAIVVSRGLRRGLESINVVMVVTIMALILVLADYAAGSGVWNAAVQLLLTSDFQRIGYEAVVAAFSHAFFGLSLGTGVMMMYGAYLSRDHSIPRLAFSIVLLDGALMVVASFAVLALVLGSGLAPAPGPGLAFQALPVALGKLEAGAVLSFVFYLLLLLTALTTSVALLEPAVVWLIETRRVQRVHATVMAAGGIWLLGIVSVLSFNRWSAHTVFGKNGFGLLDFVAANLMLPVCGLLTVVFVGWVLGRAWCREQFASGRTSYAIWRFTLRFVGPVAVIAVLIWPIGGAQLVNGWLG